MTEDKREERLDEATEVTSEDFISLETDTADGQIVESTEVVGDAKIEVENLPSPQIPTLPAVDALDDLTEATSVIDAGFAAPPVPEEPPIDVLGERSGSGADVAVAATEVETVEEEPSWQEVDAATVDDVTSTGVLRRSLLDGPQVEQETMVDAVPVLPAPMTPSIPAPADPAAQHSLDAALLEGATILPEVPSRAPARWLSSLAFLLLTPIAWYLLADAGGRLLIADGAPWLTGQMNLAALAELLGGIAILILLAVVAMQSSLGLYISGTLIALGGLPFLFFPLQTQTILDGPVRQFLDYLGAMGDNIAFYLAFSGATGIFFVLGISMILSAVVVTRVRRKGRTEESLRVEVAEVNPAGLKARWSRKAG